MQKLKCMSCGGSMYAEGGFVTEEEASGYQPNPMEHPDHMDEHMIPNQEDGEDMLFEETMRPKAKGYSMGGKVANESLPMADGEEAEYDDLVKDDDLESTYTGKNSGDEIGNAEHEKEEDEDMDEFMKSKKKKS